MAVAPAVIQLLLTGDAGFEPHATQGDDQEYATGNCRGEKSSKSRDETSSGIEQTSHLHEPCCSSSRES